MDCVKARTIFLAKEVRQQTETDVAQAEHHVTACQACQEYFKFNSQFQEFLQGKLSNSNTPVSVREKFLDALASIEHEPATSARKVKSGRWMIWAAVFAVVIIGALPFAIRMFRQNDTTAYQLVTLLIQDHIEIQLRENPVDIQTSDKVQLEQWFTKRVEFAVNIPLLQDANLKGGRLCYFLKRRVAFIVFERSNALISSYILNGEGIDLSSLKQVLSSNGKILYQWNENGYNVMLWNSSGLVYALVSTLPADELTKLAAAT